MIATARLLMLSRDDAWLKSLSDRIDRLGLRTLGATEPEAGAAALAAMPIEAILISDSAAAQWPDAAARLRHAAWPRRVPLILMREDNDYQVPEGWDMVFTHDAHPQQIVLMIEHLVRECVAEEEYDTRSATFNISADEIEKVDKLDKPLAILSIGSPDPDFLALTHRLRTRGLEVVAALSSYSAFDYLHDRTFDAVLLWGGDQPSEQLAIASGMRRNTRLYHTPVMLRLQQETELDLGDAYLRGVTDVANPKAPVAEIADRLERLARGHRRQLTIRKTLESMRNHAEMDKATGLFGRDLFAAHLAHLSQAAAERQRTLSICVLKIAETPDIALARQRKALDRAVPQIGSMIARLIRAEDSAGRLSNDVFALALPATTEAAARAVGERISAVISCTAFDSGTGKAPYVVEFEVGSAQLRQGEPAAAALMRAADSVGNHDRQAV